MSVSCFCAALFSSAGRSAASFAQALSRGLNIFKSTLLLTLSAAAALCLAALYTPPAAAADFSGHSAVVISFSLLHNRVGGDSFAAEHSVGLTEHIGDLIAAETGADKILLRRAKLLPNDYQQAADLADAEQHAHARPALAFMPDVSAYDVIFVGFPTWSGTYPAAFDIFFDTGALEGKVVIPFCTHLGSGFGNALADLNAALPDSTVTACFAVNGRQVYSERTEAELKAFLEELQF
ncbi:MAG: hypothetical protein IAB19_07090 [Proteobacteria bacterium]|uniref:Flavodoxin-like domain-containing protein n=1 Tax=Candidatus Avisuccinivibrio stercorigallinarum TaxID=2840704 RepID=A0A9D9GTM6_9GAMM|nr:hypothetical protein [Candidatus Avisuccinivibrio stercorigallinarum]